MGGGIVQMGHAARPQHTLPHTLATLFPSPQPIPPATSATLLLKHDAPVVTQAAATVDNVRQRNAAPERPVLKVLVRLGVRGNVRKRRICVARGIEQAPPASGGGGRVSLGQEEVVGPTGNLRWVGGQRTASALRAPRRTKCPRASRHSKLRGPRAAKDLPRHRWKQGSGATCQQLQRVVQP